MILAPKISKLDARFVLAAVVVPLVTFFCGQGTHRYSQRDARSRLAADAELLAKFKREVSIVPYGIQRMQQSIAARLSILADIERDCPTSVDLWG